MYAITVDWKFYLWLFLQTKDPERVKTLRYFVKTPTTNNEVKKDAVGEYFAKEARIYEKLFTRFHLEGASCLALAVPKSFTYCFFQMSPLGDPSV